jgi:hypothetical protein
MSQLISAVDLKATADESILEEEHRDDKYILP